MQLKPLRAAVNMNIPSLARDENSARRAWCKVKAKLSCAYFSTRKQNVGGIHV
jgi:hypothetical protein